MFIALLLFVPAIGQDTTTTIPLTSLYSPDVSQSCTIMQNCPLRGNFPNRGICVSVPQMGGTQCWDVCNPSHNASDYMVAGGGQIDVMNFVASELVSQVRAGLNNNVTCPKQLQLTVTSMQCPIGDACPKNLRHQFKVPYGRGLCVVKGDEKHGFACFDMCDYRIPASRFSEGAHQGIALQVMNFRSSGACQNKPWLPWVMALLFLLLIAGCFGLYYIQRRRSRRAEVAMKGEDDEEYTEEHDGEEHEHDQDRPPFEDRPGYGRQEMDAEYGMSAPGRASASSEVPPISGYMPDQLGTTGQLGATGTSLKIAGLDEPHLPMPNVGFGIPSNTVASASAVSVGGVQGGPYGMQLPLLQPSSPQAYATQLPSYPVGATSPGANVFTTTLPSAYTAGGVPASSGSVRISSPIPIQTVPQTYTSYTMPS